MEVAHLALRTPQARWALAHPTRITVEDGRLAVTGLDLRSGAQVIAGELEKTGRRGHLALHVAGFDPGRLPPALAPRALAAVGRVDLDADLTFTPSRLRGRLTAGALGTGLRAAFDLPPAWPPRAGRAPVSLQLATDEIDVQTVARAVAAATGKPAPLDPRGKLRLAVTVDGSAERPLLDLRLDGRAVALAGRTLGDLSVALHGDDARPLTLQVSATQRAAPATLTATTPLSLRALLRGPPDTRTLLRTPVTIDGQVEKASLPALAALAGVRGIHGGTLTLHLSARGTALDPTGTLAVDLAGVTTRRVPATDARVELTLDRRATQANVRVVRAGHPLLALVARLGADVGALADRARLAEAPLSVRAVVGPLELRRLGLPAQVTGGARESALAGTLHADLTLDGNLRAPRLLAHVQAGDLRLDEARVGYLDAAIRYAGGKANVDLRGASANGGTLALDVVARADLGLAALRAHPPDLQRLPLEVHLAAQKLDLRGLSGLTPALRRAGGVLDAEVDARGDLREPRFSGRVTCTKCELQLAGVGDFHDIHLALHGDTDQIVLDDLSAKSGDGNARVIATLSRDPK
ncbi:MAG TPA: hypothetical protein VHO06_25390, partial [Polyangia bacterium]|nr:hypothetical protein [Polyangia bacterium]